MSEVLSINLPAPKQKVPNDLAVTAVSVPVYRKADNIVRVYSISFGLPANTHIRVVRQVEGGTVPVAGFSVQVGPLVRTSDANGDIFDFLPEGEEVTVSTSEGTYFATTQNITRPAELDEPYYLVTVILRKRWKYRVRAVNLVSQSPWAETTLTN